MRAWTYSRIGMAFLFIPINVMAFYFIPKEKMNNATGIINLARNLGGSVGIANVASSPRARRRSGSSGRAGRSPPPY